MIKINSIFLFLIILLPSLNFISNKAIFITIFLLSFISFVYINKKNIILNKKIINVIVFLVFFSIYSSFVFILNMKCVGIRDIFEIFKYIVWILILLYGYNNALNVLLINKVRLIIFFILSLELFMIVVQFFHIDPINHLFNLFFNLKKYFETDRIIGTFSNPNILGFYLIIIYFYIRITNYRFNVFLFFLFLIFILLSSSRSMLIFFIIFTISYEINLKKILSIKFYISLILLLLIMYFIWKFVILNSNIFVFKYVSELVNLFLSGSMDVSKISSFSQRINIWSNVLDFIQSNQLYSFFGFSPRKEYGFTYIDNQFLFTYFRWGILGSLIFYGIWTYIYFILNKYNNLFLAKFLKVYWFLLLVYGFVGESFSSWTITLPFFYFLGGLLNVKKIKSINCNYR